MIEVCSRYRRKAPHPDFAGRCQRHEDVVITAAGAGLNQNGGPLEAVEFNVGAMEKLVLHLAGRLGDEVQVISRLKIEQRNCDSFAMAVLVAGSTLSSCVGARLRKLLPRLVTITVPCHLGGSPRHVDDRLRVDAIDQAQGSGDRF
jgi:hypothetical protein